MPNPATERGCIHMMEIIASLIVAIAGGVACHYIIKWLDGNEHDN